MELPEDYRAPKLENLASRAEVAWGQCNTGSAALGEECGGGAVAGTCVLVGQSASGVCTDWGSSASTGSCAIPGVVAT